LLFLLLPHLPVSLSVCVLIYSPLVDILENIGEHLEIGGMPWFFFFFDLKKEGESVHIWPSNLDKNHVKSKKKGMVSTVQNFLGH